MATITEKYPLYGEFRIAPIAVAGHAAADGVYVNAEGKAFAGEIHPMEAQEGDYLENTSGWGVMPYCDEGGDYISAPEGWQELVIERVN